MGGILRLWFLQIRLAFFLVVPLVAFTILHSTHWSGVQGLTEQALSGIADPQDITLPLLRWRGIKPGKRTHFWLLRGAVLMVALLAFSYSAILYSPTEPIMLYLAITGAIFLGWSGTVIIGGLYWDRGTTRAAWVTAIIGSVFTLTSFLLQRMNDALDKGGGPFFGWFGESGPVSDAAQWIALHMPDGKETLGLTMFICAGTYVVISLVQNRRFDLDALLHRGVHAIEGEVQIGAARVSRLGRWLSFTQEHTRLDRRTRRLRRRQRRLISP